MFEHPHQHIPPGAPPYPSTHLVSVVVPQTQYRPPPTQYAPQPVYHPQHVYHSSPYRRHLQYPPPMPAHRSGLYELTRHYPILAALLGNLTTEDLYHLKQVATPFYQALRDRRYPTLCENVCTKCRYISVVEHWRFIKGQGRELLCLTMP